MGWILIGLLIFVLLTSLIKQPKRQINYKKYFSENFNKFSPKKFEYHCHFNSHYEIHHEINENKLETHKLYFH